MISSDLALNDNAKGLNDSIFEYTPGLVKKRYKRCTKCRGFGHSVTVCPNKRVVTLEEARQIDQMLKAERLEYSLNVLRREHEEEKRIAYDPPLKLSNYFSQGASSSHDVVLESCPVYDSYGLEEEFDRVPNLSPHDEGLQIEVNSGGSLFDNSSNPIPTSWPDLFEDSITDLNELELIGEHIFDAYDQRGERQEMFCANQMQNPPHAVINSGAIWTELLVDEMFISCATEMQPDPIFDSYDVGDEEKNFFDILPSGIGSEACTETAAAPILTESASFDTNSPNLLEHEMVELPASDPHISLWFFDHKSYGEVVLEAWAESMANSKVERLKRLSLVAFGDIKRTTKVDWQDYLEYLQCTFILCTPQTFMIKKNHCHVVWDATKSKSFWIRGRVLSSLLGTFASMSLHCSFYKLQDLRTNLFLEGEFDAGAS